MGQTNRRKSPQQKKERNKWNLDKNVNVVITQKTTQRNRRNALVGAG